MKGEKKMTDTALATNDVNTQLKEAIAAGDIDLSQLQELLAAGGMKVVAKGSEDKYSRKAKQAKWESAKELDEDEKKTIAKLPEVLGSITPVEGTVLSQAQVDTLAQEELVRRETEDIVKGRAAAIKATLINSLRASNPDEEYPVGDFASATTGYKFSIYNQERGGKADYAKLQEAVGEDVWAEITDEVTTRSINEEKLTKALAEGKVTLEQFSEAVPPKTVSQAWTFKPLKAGDDV